MASRKKSTKSEEIVAKTEVPVEETATDEIVSEVRPEKEETPVNVEEKPKKTQKTTKKVEKTQKVEEKTQKVEEKSPKYPIGSIVFVSKDAEADLNGFKLFPPYKKSTYTVEAYNPISDVYSLRRLNLSLKLKEVDIVAPSERAHDPLNRRQF